jgi:DNA-binding FadR family transcriptional regulator
MQKLSTPTYPSRSLHGSIVHELGRRIVTGIYESGATLPVEEALREELNVSRNALREAVKVLSAKGLLKVKTRTGTQVQAREQWHLTDPDVLAWAMTGEVDQEVFSWLTEFRKVIEPAAAELAAIRASVSERANIERQMHELERVNDCLDSGEATLEEYGEVDMNFHEAIFLASGNPFLQSVTTSISSALARSRRLTDKIPGARVRAFPVHLKIGQAVLDGRPMDAREAMLELFELVSEDVESAYSE